MRHTIPFFSDLTDHELETIQNHAITRVYPRNSIIINEGDISDSVYFILEGKVKVYLSDDDGKEVVLNTQGPGEYFGELALLDKAPRSASVITTEKTMLSLITKTDFSDCISKHPDIAIRIMHALVKRLRGLTDDVKSLALMDVYGRVARALLKLAEPQNGQLIIKDKLTHQDIADRVGSSREMVTRIMKDLRTGGYIQVDGKQTIIKEKLPQRW